MAKWLAKEFDWDTGRYTGKYYDIAEVGIVAVFVDSFYGLDTNAGTAAAPFKTLGAAITYLNANGANGSRIFMNGIFSETLPAQTYWYEFIGCGGGENGRTLFNHNDPLNQYVIFRPNSRYLNIKTINYVTTKDTTNNTGGSYYFVNCLIKNALLKGNLGDVTMIAIYSYNTIFSYCNFGRSNVHNRYSRLYGNQNIYYNIGAYTGTYSSVLARCQLFGNNSFVNNSNYLAVGSDFTLDVDNAGFSNIMNITGQLINPDQNDFNVRITSPLLQAGTVDEITGIAANVGGVEVGLPYNGITPEFTTEGGATITDLTIDSTGRFTITSPATTGTLETALMDLGNIYPLENIDLFNVFDFASGEITQGVFEAFSSPRMALTIKLKYGLTSAEVDECPWLLIEYGKQPTFSGTGASRVGNAADTFDPDTFQTITCRYMKLFITLQNNS